jgi:hypothetical protein
MGVVEDGWRMVVVGRWMSEREVRGGGMVVYKDAGWSRLGIKSC